MSEERFEELLRRGLRAQPPARHRRSVLVLEPVRLAAAVVLVLAVLSGAIVVGGRLAQYRSGAASPAPASNTVSARPPEIDGRYGILIATRDSLLVRRETDGQLLHEMPLYTRALVRYAISRDGRYVAYWARTSQSIQDYDLRVYDAATNSERVVLHEVSALFLPSSITWASDESGVAYGVVALLPRRDQLAHPPELRTTDLASGQTKTLYRGDTEGPLLMPVAWDREQQLIGAVRLSTTQMPDRYLRISESGQDTRIDPAPMADAPHAIVGLIGDGARGFAAAIDLYNCSGGDQKCSQLRAWPLEREFRTAAGPVGELGTIFRRLRFIPSSRRVLALADAPGSAGTRLEVIDPNGRQLTAVLREYDDPKPEREVFLRPDGTGAYVFELGDGGWTGELVGLSGTAVRAVPKWDAGGRPVDVLTLDVAEAQRVRSAPVPAHLLTRDEIAALVPTSADVRVDRSQAALVTGKLPPSVQSGSGDVVGPGWVVVRTGEFNWQGTTGLAPRPRNQPCQVWVFDARTGSANGYSLGPLSVCNETLASGSFAPLAAPTATPVVHRGSAPAALARFFDMPPAYPGYLWTRNGRRVSEFEFETVAGPDHCGWQSATMLFIGWPPGTVTMSSAEARQYIRDPRGVIQGRLELRRWDPHATLPSEARSTGYRYGTLEVYVSPSDQDRFIYVVGPDGAERWPRSDPMIVCS